MNEGMNILNPPAQHTYVNAGILVLLIGYWLTRNRETQAGRFIRIAATIAIVTFAISGASLVHAVKTPDFIGIIDQEAYLRGVGRVLLGSTAIALLWVGVIGKHIAALMTVVLEGPDQGPTMASQVDKSLHRIHKLEQAGQTAKAIHLCQQLIREKKGSPLMLQALIGHIRPADPESHRAHDRGCVRMRDAQKMAGTVRLVA